jgi:hypothetical protein
MQDNTLSPDLMAVESILVLKRKTMYVKRYAKIENFIFSYKKSKCKVLKFN